MTPNVVSGRGEKPHDECRRPANAGIVVNCIPSYSYTILLSGTTTLDAFPTSKQYRPWNDSMQAQYKWNYKDIQSLSASQASGQEPMERRGTEHAALRDRHRRRELPQPMEICTNNSRRSRYCWSSHYHRSWFVPIPQAMVAEEGQDPELVLA